MAARSSTMILSRALRSQRTTQMPRAASRLYSTSVDDEKRPSIVKNPDDADTGITNKQGTFYKTFTRPVLKVLLMATLTYQIAYWTWTKLEQDEIRGEKSKEIESLEAKVAELQAGKGTKA
ncbi:uncharacterized protein CCOS01_01099 [Colletotrichum costaricense]|uniref:Inner membrane assembly complex subunit 17 n=2 Tax=Colletotrichum acutatum species complex TaxID=2707335 RepID=A0AAI9ZCB3_9PEZI|nr:uncharacterized protein CCOS01_01099 [Colletotrichum costaricense]XP_060384914.1 uncharacterized protein CTAM01_04239 [Colletotrichum tamarilloi]KAK1504009.1 hypothetical protein CTAM01_04239 [Colletotrichum tamarilloi]KAK1539785.1 hypothetical protein CCOS01_01099 [Colletotrichum costaricense]